MTLTPRRRRDRRKCRLRRVWFNGVDVTNRCFYADGRRGVVRMYKLNAEGRKYVDPNVRVRLATEERRGRVQWGWLR